MDLEILLSEFLDDIARSQTVEFSKGVTNFFAKLQETLASGQVPFSTPLAPITEDDKLVDYGAPDFGIEIPGTHIIFSKLSPCLPFSDAQKKATLNWAKELGARNVPSLYAIKKCQKFVEDFLGQPTEKVTARSGNTFYINNIAKAIALDYGNPLTHFAMQDYPEDGGKRMSQVFNGKNMLLDLPSPSAAQVDGKAGFIINNEWEIIPTSMFVWSYEDIASTGELDCSLTVPLIIFMDDISGNILKQWNKHHVIYMSNANLPHEMLEKEFFVCFVTSSPHAAPMELIDAADSEEVMLIPYRLFIAGDNPMQAEECSHTGLNCNYFCQTCNVSGMKEYKTSNEGYNSIFTTTEGIQHQFDAAVKPAATTKVQNAMSSTSICDSALVSILESLVELGKKLHKCEPGSQAKSKGEVIAALEKENQYASSPQWQTTIQNSLLWD
ncbi:hypothetical protein BDR04DRAFT_1130971 [Suillus decipiens]|nr:hypothetical protein BDR04DRAFT_1130971 [Suillus decipiens]